MATKWLERSPAEIAFEDGKDLIRQRVRAALRPVNNRIMTMWSDEFNRRWVEGTVLKLTSTEGVDRMLMLAVVQEYGGDEMVDLLVDKDPELAEAARVLRAGESG